MLKYFPILPDEKVKKYTNDGYMFVFRYMKAIDEVRPKDLIHKSEINDEDRIPLLNTGDKIEKIVSFDEGYNFLKDSDLQYNLRVPKNLDLQIWVEYYDISDEENEETRKYRLGDLYKTIGIAYKN